MQEETVFFTAISLACHILKHNSVFFSSAAGKLTLYVGTEGKKKITDYARNACCSIFQEKKKSLSKITIHVYFKFNLDMADS